MKTEDSAIDPRKPKAPAHLNAETQRWWSLIAKEYELESHHLRLLTLAAKQWDRAEAAERKIKHDGIFVKDRFGQQRANPAVAIARDASIAFARLMRELALDDAGDPSRPPRVGGGT